ncbi:MAG: hypothetical protein GY769_17580 [bacterium]|nr:hypothetical protein [bacterium]
MSYYDGWKLQGSSPDEAAERAWERLQDEAAGLESNRAKDAFAEFMDGSPEYEGDRDSFATWAEENLFESWHEQDEDYAEEMRAEWRSGR